VEASSRRRPGRGHGLCTLTSYAVSHPVLPLYSWIVEHLALPHFQVFGWVVLAAETALAVLLLAGIWVRTAATLGIAQSLAIALSVTYAPAEWAWSHWLMIGAQVVILFSFAGRALSVEAVLAGLSRSTSLPRVWGLLAVIVGLTAVGRSGLSESLGSDNVVGGLVLLLTGALLLAGQRLDSGAGRRRFTLNAAGLALVAAASLYVQLGFSDPVLGGSATSAAYLLCFAAVALAAAAGTTTVPGPRCASTPSEAT